MFGRKSRKRILKSFSLFFFFLFIFAYSKKKKKTKTLFFFYLSTVEVKGKDVVPRREEIMVVNGGVLINEDRTVEKKDLH